MTGLELQISLSTRSETPMILMSGLSGAQEATLAFRAGAIDFLVKPIGIDDLLKAVRTALHASDQRGLEKLHSLELQTRMQSLTERERTVAERVSLGDTNIQIAGALQIALRTVKLYRHRAMAKLKVSTVVDLARVMDESKN